MSEDIVRKLAEAAKDPAPHVDPQALMDAITHAMGEELARQDPKGIGHMHPEGVMKAVIALPATVLNAAVASHHDNDMPMPLEDFDRICESVVLRVADNLALLRALLISKGAFK